MRNCLSDDDSLEERIRDLETAEGGTGGGNTFGTWDVFESSFKPGYYFRSSTFIFSGEVGNVGFNQIFYTPLFVPLGLSIDQVSITVNLTASYNYKFAIYSDHGNGHPKDLLQDLGTHNVPASGTALRTIDWAVSYTFPSEGDNLFWWAMCHDRSTVASMYRSVSNWRWPWLPAVTNEFAGIAGIYYRSPSTTTFPTSIAFGSLNDSDVGSSTPLAALRIA